MSYFDNFENKSSNKENIFNKGNAGEAKVTMQTTLITAGSPKSNGGTVANDYYNVVFSDANNAQARPINTGVFPFTLSQDGSEPKIGSINARLTTAKHLYIACGGNLADLPNPGSEVNMANANIVLKAMMDYVVSKTQIPVEGRGYFQYARNNKQDGYLNYRDGFKCGFTTDSAYVFEASDLIFLSRPPMANATSTTTTSTTDDSLPF